MDPIVAPPAPPSGLLSSLVNRLIDSHIVSANFGASLKNCNPSTPVMFGKVKTHKAGLPLRGIINCKDSISYSLENWLAPILKKLLAFYPRVVKNSKAVVEALKS